ncbi:MAG TPA: hypothetical protein VJ853_09385 [Thermoanaerobaculia bacterium]|nr:hypothetical protein [Thermoanaerobaculia bacterium]
MLGKQKMNLSSIMLWGLAATLILTTITIAGQSLGLTRLDMPFIIGTMFTPDRDRAKVIGYVFHVLNGWILAVVYALFFENVHAATWWFGALIGALQGVIVVVVILPLLPGVHPRMVSDFRGPEPTRLLEPPGYLATNYGRFTPLITIFAHTVYGIILGLFYVPR